MNLEAFWDSIFSEDRERVLAAWSALEQAERPPVRDLLDAITRDAERIEEQRRAAAFALGVIGPAVSGPVSLSSPPVPLPDGALDFARALARETGDMLRSKFGLLVASRKKDDSLVTEFDIAADRLIVRAITARFPGHGILSEESNTVYGGEEWCWVIDPIDGTTNFTWGFPVWGVLIGLLHRGEPVLGVAEFPMTGEQYSAVAGESALCNDAPIFASSAVAMDSALLFACCTRTMKHGRPNVPLKLRIAGAAGFDLAMLACGACLGVLEMTVHVWDVAALMPVLRAAGGVTAVNMPGGVFPLRPGTDYAGVSFAVLGASSPAMLEVLAERLADRFVPRG